MSNKLYYKSKFTEFQTTEPPYTDKIYFKHGNDTVCIIHIDSNWNMYGEVKDPFNIPLDMLNPKFRDLTQKECEELIMRHMPPLRRTDVPKRWNMEIVDYAQLMYRTRLITCIDNYWAAWSEGDRAEDYHPRYNPEIMKQRFDGVEYHFDDYKQSEIIGPDLVKDAMDYHEPNFEGGYINPDFLNMEFGEEDIFAHLGEVE